MGQSTIPVMMDGVWTPCKDVVPSVAVGESELHCTSERKRKRETWYGEVRNVGQERFSKAMRDRKA